MPDEIAIEIAPFTVAPGVTEEQLLAASERLEHEFLSGASGYLGRTLARLNATAWADIVVWRSEADAASILPHIPNSPACAAYFECMVGADTNEPAHGVSLFRSVRAYGLLAGI